MARSAVAGAQYPLGPWLTIGMLVMRTSPFSLRLTFFVSVAFRMESLTRVTLPAASATLMGTMRRLTYSSSRSDKMNEWPLRSHLRTLRLSAFSP